MKPWPSTLIVLQQSSIKNSSQNAALTFLNCQRCSLSKSFTIKLKSDQWSTNLIIQTCSLHRSKSFTKPLLSYKCKTPLTKGFPIMNYRITGWYIYPLTHSYNRGWLANYVSALYTINSLLKRSILLYPFIQWSTWFASRLINQFKGFPQLWISCQVVPT